MSKDLDPARYSLQELLDHKSGEALTIELPLKQLEFLRTTLGVNEAQAVKLALSVFCWIVKAAGPNGWTKLRAGEPFSCTLSTQNGYGPQKGRATHSLTLEGPWDA